MTEAEWNACKKPGPMLRWLRHRASERKLRLFGCACCRRIWPLLANEESRRVVQTSEQFADGLATEEELREMQGEALVAYHEARIALETERLARGGRRQDRLVVFRAASAAIRTAMGEGAQDVALAAPNKPMWQCSMLRDIFGSLLFRAMTIAPAWLAWNDSTVRRLAEAAYQDRLLPAGTLDAGQLAVLADALEEAGCNNEEILSHLRRQRVSHYRGCWVIDLLLNKN